MDENLKKREGDSLREREKDGKNNFAKRKTLFPRVGKTLFPRVGKTLFPRVGKRCLAEIRFFFFFRTWRENKVCKIKDRVKVSQK